jgi:hypothetical protein
MTLSFSSAECNDQMRPLFEQIQQEYTIIQRKKISRLTWPNIVRQTKVYDFQGRILILGLEKEILKMKLKGKLTLASALKTTVIIALMLKQ